MRPRRKPRPTASVAIDEERAAALWRTIALGARRLDPADWDHELAGSRMLDKMAAGRLRRLVLDPERAPVGALVDDWREIVEASGVTVAGPDEVA